MGVQELFSSSDGETSLSAATSGTGSVKAVHGARQVDWYIQAIGACTGGVVVFEHNEVSASYAGTWDPMDSVDFSVTPLTDAVRAAGTFPGDLKFTRWRITSAITGGGSITARINGLKG